MALPLALSGQDVIGQARTGTGKTYAFGVAMLQRVGKPRKNRKKPRGLVVVPTRELALQVTEDLVIAGGKLGSRVLTVYGGRAYEPQVDALALGVDVVVGTPGRLLDLVKQKHLDLGQVNMLVLDEADRMLDLGFLPDIERIIKLVPAERQTMLFSATMPGEIVALARKYLNRPTHVRADEPVTEPDATPQTVQHVFRTHRMDKIEILSRMLQAVGRGLTMVFCETKRACDMVSEQLQDRGFAAAAVHGDLGQGQREQALRAFRNGKIDVLVATDVAARGIDIDDVTHVVNYDCPQDDKHYVHRIGRTGRAGRTGIAVTFVEWEELTRWKVINTTLGLDFPEPPETYSTSPNLYSELAIPEGTKGVLPHAKRSRAGLDAEKLEDVGETGRIRSRRKTDRRDERPADRRNERRDERRDDGREERPRRERQRRRTRSGRALADAAATEPGTDTGIAGTAEVAVEDLPTLITSEEAEAAVTPIRTRRGANKAALSEALAEAVITDDPVEAPTRQTPISEDLEDAVDQRAEYASAERAAPPAPRPEPERIVPPSPFSVIFQSPDLATEDDAPAPSAASERVQQRRRPTRPRPRRDG
jgi:superfamily II DNA/RNA helicase